jgi:hypothetical protein
VEGGVGEGQEVRGDITASVFRRFIFVFFNIVAWKGGQSVRVKNRVRVMRWFG